MADRFWSDDFDMDLLKLVPDARALLGDAADLVLYTYGHTSFGRLNHPAVWNGSGSTYAFVGFENPPHKPEFYYTNDPVVECTGLELVRDAWCHHYFVILDGAHAFGSERLEDDFLRIMYTIRKWEGRAETAERLESRVRKVRRWVEDVGAVLVELHARFAAKEGR